MTHDDETSTKRITNLESFLDNFQRDKEISESNDKEYSQKTKKNQQPYVKNANLSKIKLRQDMTKEAKDKKESNECYCTNKYCNSFRKG